MMKRLPFHAHIATTLVCSSCRDGDCNISDRFLVQNRGLQNITSCRKMEIESPRLSEKKLHEMPFSCNSFQLCPLLLQSLLLQFQETLYRMHMDKTSGFDSVLSFIGCFQGFISACFVSNFSWAILDDIKTVIQWKRIISVLSRLDCDHNDKGLGDMVVGGWMWPWGTSFVLRNWTLPCTLYFAHHRYSIVGMFNVVLDNNIILHKNLQYAIFQPFCSEFSQVRKSPKLHVDVVLI